MFFSGEVRLDFKIQDLQMCQWLILGHHTSSAILEKIEKNGLLPNSLTNKTYDDGVTSDRNCVYLSSKLDTLYFDRAKEKGGYGIVVVVKVKREMLEPDESSMSPQQNETYSFFERLLYSLNFGACKYRGKILPNQVVGIYDENGFKIH